jgi:ubiquinone/menaquinone biosynthesis C-methylase UbiE
MTHTVSTKQKASADFYGQYFWKDYEIQENAHLDFVIRGLCQKNLENAQTLLDMGAGSGKFSILLKRRFPHLEITSVDLSPDNIDTITHNAKMANVRITPKQASVTDLPFESNQFDLVLCVYMLQHTDAPAQGFSESARVLKKGGTAFYAIGCDNGLSKIHRGSRFFFNRVPASWRTVSVYPLLPFYWTLTHLLKSNKASYGELSKDLVDWLYNPLQNFIPKTDIQNWFAQHNLNFEHLGYTGLFKSMMLCRGSKR